MSDLSAQVLRTKSDDELRTELDLSAARLRKPVNDLFAGWIVVFEHLECLRHHAPPFWVTSSKTVARSSN